MNLKELSEVLTGARDVSDFLAGIRDEVQGFRTASSKRGASTPIHVTEDNFHFVVGREEVKRLCSLFLRGLLDEWQLQYIANAIDLSSSGAVEDEKVKEAIFQFADPEINAPLTAASVKAICESLGKIG